VSHLEVIVALIVVFDGCPPPLGGRLTGGAKSGDVKSELLRRGCSSATITRSGLSFVYGRLLREWLAVIGDGALVPLQEVGAALRAVFELGNDDLRVTSAPCLLSGGRQWFASGSRSCWFLTSSATMTRCSVVLYRDTWVG